MDTNLIINLEEGKFLKYLLFDTEISKQWLRIYNKYVGSGYKLAANSEHYIYHAFGCEQEYLPGTEYSLEGCKEKLRYYINEANSCIEGEKFPYSPDGLPSFELSNKIHRAFTVSSNSLKSWTHDLTESQLHIYKNLAHDKKRDFLANNTVRRFTLDHKNFRKFLNAVENINHWVHIVESFCRSERGYQANLEAGGSRDYSNPKGRYIELDWNQRNDNGTRPEYFGEAIDSNLSLPAMKFFDEADIFVGKNISGKDYEISFAQYDDPLEFDTVNGDFNEGTVRLHLTDEYKEFYRVGGTFDKWLTDKNISPDLYRPIPLGKLIDTNLNNYDFKVDESNTAPNGQHTLHTPFKKITIELENI